MLERGETRKDVSAKTPIRVRITAVFIFGKISFEGIARKNAKVTVSDAERGQSQGEKMAIRSAFLHIGKKSSKRTAAKKSFRRFIPLLFHEFRERGKLFRG